jgi:hypothetical protein
MFASIVILFGLCNAPATFQRVMMVTFLPYLHKFIEIFLDDFCVFGTKEEHVEQLTKCFEQCEKYGISKCSKMPICGSFWPIIGAYGKQSWHSS